MTDGHLVISLTHFVVPKYAGHLIGVVDGQMEPPSKTGPQSHGAATHAPDVQRYGRELSLVVSSLQGSAIGHSSIVAAQL